MYMMGPPEQVQINAVFIHLSWSHKALFSFQEHVGTSILRKHFSRYRVMISSFFLLSEKAVIPRSNPKTEPSQSLIHNSATHLDT